MEVNSPNTNQAQEVILNIPDKSRTALSDECWIYKVPKYLNKENKDIYIPNLISIGPMHREDEKLKSMDNQKYYYFKCFSNRPLPREHRSIEKYIKFLQENEVEIRSHYSEEYPKIDKTEFVKMMLLDSVFILELFLRISENDTKIREKYKEEDYLFGQSWILKNVERDLLLIENQLPFNILEKLYRYFREPSSMDLVELARNFFKVYDPYPAVPAVDHEYSKSNCFSFCSKSKSNSTSSEDKKNCKCLPKKKQKNGELNDDWKSPKHLLDLVRYFFVPRYMLMSLCDDLPVKKATKLREAGITFEPVSNRCQIDVEFKRNKYFHWLCCCPSKRIKDHIKASLQIPTLKIDDSTEFLLRNIMVLEQCLYPDNPYVCHYVALFCDLIQTKEDVDVLVESEAIIHKLGSDEDLVTLFNVLCRDIVITKTCYPQLIKDLRDHYGSNWNKTMAAVGLVYFKNLWRGSATIVGLVFLAFAFLNFARALQEYWLHLH